MITISHVVPSSPAEKAGIKSGDVILNINDREINDVLDYRFETASKRLEIKVIQDGAEKSITVLKKPAANTRWWMIAKVRWKPPLAKNKNC